MKLERLQEDLVKFRTAQTLTVEDMLGILQNVSKDVKDESGLSVEKCAVRDPNALMALLLWMGKLYGRVYRAHEEELSGARRIKDYQELEKELCAQLAEGEAAQQALPTLQAHVEALREKCAVCAQAKTRQEALGREQEELQQTLSALEAGQPDVTLLQQQVDELRNKVCALQTQREALCTEKSALSEKEQTLHRQIAEITSAVQESTEAIQADSKKKIALEEENQQKNEEFGALGEQIVALEKENYQLKVKVGHAEQTSAGLTEAVSAAKEACAQAEERVSSLQEELKTLEVGQEQKQADIALLEITIKKLKSTLPEDERLLEDRTAEKEALTAQAEELARELLETGERIATIKETEIPEQKQKKTALEQQEVELSGLLDAYVHTLEQAQEELMQLQQQVTQTEEQKQEKETELRQMRELLNEKTGALQTVDETIANLRQQLTALENQLAGRSEEGMQKTLEERKAVLQGHLSACAKLEEELQTAQEELVRQEEKKNGLRQTIADTQKRTEEVKNELEKYRTALSSLAGREKEMQKNEQILHTYKQIHDALVKQASRFGEIHGMEAYDGDIVAPMLQQVKEDMQQMRELIDKYVRATNQKMEGIV